MALRILVVEFDPVTTRYLQMILTQAGFDIDTTESGYDALEMARIYDYDLITLAIDISDMGGHDVLHSIRQERITTPILMLSKHDDTENKLKAFWHGADDYLTKPFHREELVARVNTIIRRSQGHAHDIIQTGPVSVNLSTKRVTVDNKLVHLTGKEYQMLEVLSRRRGKTITTEMFLDHLYGGIDEPGAKIIDVFICKLRKKLGPNHGIETVWGEGYVLHELVPA